MQSSSRRSRTGSVVGLVTVCVASALLPVSLTGSSVAMPGVAADFHSGLAAGQWMVNGYDLTFAAFMLTTGALADRFGRRRLFAMGSAVFAACSYISSLAAGIVMLDVARFGAGIGAAAVTTAGSAVLADLFDGPARARAFSAFGTAIGVGLAFGPFVAGTLQTTFGWRAVFLVPAALSTVVLCLSLLLPESSDPAGGRVDLPGMVCFTGALAALIWALLEGPQNGWASALNITAYVVFAVLLAGFIRVETHSPHPMFDLGLFRRAQFVSLCFGVVALVFGFTPLLVYLPTYLTSVNGETTFRAGLDLLMLTGPTLVFPMLAGHALRWFPVRLLVIASVALTAIGCGWLVVIAPGIGNWPVLGPLLVIGTGVGISFGVMDGAAVSSVDPSRAGMAVGMFNTMRLSGEAIAIAVGGSLLVSLTRRQLADRLADAPGVRADAPAGLADEVGQGRLTDALSTVPDTARSTLAGIARNGYTGALHDVLWCLAAFCLVATFVLATVGRGRRAAVPDARVGKTADEAARDREPV